MMDTSTKQDVMGTVVGVGGLIFSLGVLVSLGRGVWWLKTGVWIDLSVVSAISYKNPEMANSIMTSIDNIEWTGVQKIIWYVLIDAPLAGLLMVIGTIIAGIALILDSNT